MTIHNSSELTEWCHPNINGFSEHISNPLAHSGISCQDRTGNATSQIILLLKLNEQNEITVTQACVFNTCSEAGWRPVVPHLSWAGWRDAERSGGRRGNQASANLNRNHFLTRKRIICALWVEIPHPTSRQSAKNTSLDCSLQTKIFFSLIVG